MTYYTSETISLMILTVVIFFIFIIIMGQPPKPFGDSMYIRDTISVKKGNMVYEIK